jgi:hypothetical protein
LSADFHNAFNTIRRSSIKKALLDNCPFLVPFFMYGYSQPSKVFFRGMDPGEHLDITTGVKQGDPIATFCFCITLQAVLQSATDAHPEAHVIAFADDVHILGLAPAAEEAFTTLIEQGQERGLTPSLHNCTAFSVTSSASQAVAASLSIQHATHGVVACGTPIGCTEYVQAFVQEKAQQATTLIDKLAHLPVSSQTKWILLHRSLQRKLNHLKFTVPWHILQHSLRSFEESVASSALHILDLQHPSSRRLNSDFVKIQLRLPIRQGGFGLDFTTSQIATAAWLSMAARCDLAR